MKHYRVIVIGGGPAGAVCAGRLVEEGIDCLVLDKSVFPRSKVCAGWVTPGVFRNLGLPPSEYPHPLTVFPKLMINLGRFPLRRTGLQYAIRRIEFDDWLLKRSGADFFQHEVKEILPTDFGYQIDGQFKADYLVGAGGTHCPLYQQFFKRSHPRNGTSIVAMEEEYKFEWLDSTCRLWFFWEGLPGYAWYVPKTDGYVNIGIGGNAKKIKGDGGSIREYWHKYIKFLVDHGYINERECNPQGYTYFLRGRDPVIRKGNLYLVGDSAGLSTLDMGEGIGPAIQSGLLAAQSIVQGADYKLEDIPKFSLLPEGAGWLLDKVNLIGG
jgi:flavin-dependent dehydrogenase